MVLKVLRLIPNKLELLPTSNSYIKITQLHRLDPPVLHLYPQDLLV